MGKREQQSGQSEKGEQKASSIQQALAGKVGGEEQLERPRPTVTPTEIGTAPADELAPQGALPSLFQPSLLDRAMFCRQFAMLIEVGFPALKALQLLAKRTQHSKLRKAVEDAAQGIEEGATIHQSMNRNADVFSPLVINIIRIGEMGGILEGSLVRLAEIMEAKARIKRKIVSASMYPAVALIVAVGVIMVVMVKAIPAFAEVYKDLDKSLPRETQFVIDLSHFLQATWWFLLILLVVLVVVLKLWARTPSGARVFSWLALKLWVFRDITQKIAVARTTRTLGELVLAGIPLTESLSIAADTNENVLVSDALHDVQHHVAEGERMADSLREAAVFPGLVVDMISIGEETGTLDRMLSKVADIYDAEVDSVLNGLASIIEPLLIVFMGGVVIFIALAVMQPYFSLVQAV